MLSKILLWCLGIIAIGTITMLVLYKLAIWIAAGIILLAIGFIVGIPLVLLCKWKYLKLLREQEALLRGEQVRRDYYENRHNNP